MTTPPPSTLSDFPSILQRTVNIRLNRQLTWRFFLVFVVVSLVGSVLALSSYQAFVRSAQRESADATARHIGKNYAQMSANWLRDAEEIKTQIDFMRIFDGDQADNWLRLRAYFAAIEGKVDRFAAGVVVSDKGKPLFSFGREGQNLSRRLEDDKGEPRWYYGSTHRTAWGA
jgi:hypothetical protein